MSFLQKKNNAQSTVAIQVNPSDLTVTVADGSKFPAVGDFMLTMWDKLNYPDPGDDANMEIVRATSRSGDVITISRYQEGTDFGSGVHLVGDAIESLITALLVDELRNFPVRTVTSTAVMTTSDYLLRCNGTFNVTLPSTTGSGRPYYIKNIGTGTITVVPSGSGDLIDGQTSQTVRKSDCMCFTDGASGSWDII